jgi:hypothetical protein
MQWDFFNKYFAVIAVPMLVISFSLAVHDKAYIEMFGKTTCLIATIYQKPDGNPSQERVQKKLKRKDNNK